MGKDRRECLRHHIGKLVYFSPAQRNQKLIGVNADSDFGVYISKNVFSGLTLSCEVRAPGRAQGQKISIFGNIMSAIFGSAAPVGAAPSVASPPTTPTTAPAADVDAVLTKLAAQNKEKLDWRKSIVDLMKLLELDSSLAARKQLAQVLNYSGDMNDSATMNVWLHKQVMRKLAENGGKVPADLKA